MTADPFLFDLGARGAIVLTGNDRASFLHGLVTNDVKKLTPGQGCAAAFLTSKGKMLADCVVLCEEDRLGLDCEPELSGKIEDLLRKYLVFNDVQIGNVNAENHVFHLTGASPGDAVEDLLRRSIGFGDGSTLPREPHAHATVLGAAAGGAIRIIRENRTGVPGYDLRLPSSLSKQIFSSLLSEGAHLESSERLDALRIVAGIPRWGFELTDAVLPDEAGLRERGFISENKGCYVGQETVARIKTYGHVNRKLVLLTVSGGCPKTGERIFFEGEESGTVTSAAPAVTGAEAAALAYVKRAHANRGAHFLIRTLEGDLPAVFSSVPLV
ncbi:MAG: glycine cleavage T C-terminal barrel domain-containing protein [Acidobacteriota bacterium]|nr:glycine cleavage T C-terminal barrel domain-containing protein [Acidobacteriota bacterium]